VGPWKRRRIPHASSLVLRGDAPVLAVGGMGGEKQIVATARIILNTLHHGLPIQAAVDAPRLFRGLRDEIYVSPDMPETALSGLAAMGHPVVPQDPEKFMFGRVTGILIDSGSRPGLQGGIEKYSDGKAVGY